MLGKALGARIVPERSLVGASLPAITETTNQDLVADTEGGIAAHAKAAGSSFDRAFACVGTTAMKTGCLSLEGSMKFKQFAALPFRMRDRDVEILLITTRKKGRWIVPKGWPIKRCTPHETAATEAYEEAGVRGSVDPRHIGRFQKRRLKKKQSVVCEVTIYPLAVESQHANWPEKHQRSRAWFTPRRAAKLVKKPGLRRAIRDFEERQ